MIKRSIIICCTLWIGTGCGNRIVPKRSKIDAVSVFRFLTYNIHHANPPSKPNVIDIVAIANAIKQQQPDLVALQEVDVNTNRSGKTLNEAEEIAKQAGLPYFFFAKSINYDGGEYGVAILSKFPITSFTNNPLPTVDSTGGEHRTMAKTVITLSQGKKIVFACTHLDAQRQDTNRLLQINKIVEILQKEKLPLIIAGDFNASPSGRIINVLDKYFTRSCTGNCAFTIPQINPTKTIDYIAFRPSDKFTVIEHKVIDEKYASDHLSVLAVLKIK